MQIPAQPHWHWSWHQASGHSECADWGHGHESPFCTRQPFHGLWVALALQLSVRFSALSSDELVHTLFKEENITVSLCPTLISLFSPATTCAFFGVWRRVGCIFCHSSDWTCLIALPASTAHSLSSLSKVPRWLGATRRRWPSAEAFVTWSLHCV